MNVVNLAEYRRARELKRLNRLYEIVTLELALGNEAILGTDFLASGREYAAHTYRRAEEMYLQLGEPDCEAREECQRLAQGTLY
jgi:hypothetical protein